MANEKKYTLKTAQSELNKLEEKKLKKMAELEAVKNEIKEIDISIKNINKTIDKLNSESLKKQMSEALFENSGLTNEQISKLLELSQKIGDKIDNVDVDELVSIIPEKEKVDTNINFTGNEEI